MYIILLDSQHFIQRIDLPLCFWKPFCTPLHYNCVYTIYTLPVFKNLVICTVATVTLKYDLYTHFLKHLMTLALYNLANKSNKDTIWYIGEIFWFFKYITN